MVDSSPSLLRPGFHQAHSLEGPAAAFPKDPLNRHFPMKTVNRASIGAAFAARIAVTANARSGQPSTGSAAVRPNAQLVPTSSC